MAEAERPRFDVAALRGMAGEAAFARGVEYARQDLARILSLAPGEVRAEIIGSEIYQATLNGAGAAIAGACSCPAFGSWGFCKHLVAVALTVNAASPDEIATADGAEDRLRAHLAGQTSAVLAERLLDLARRDGALWRELEFEAALTTGDDGTVLGLLRASIDEAMDTDGGVDWRGSGDWAAAVRSVVRQIAGLLAAGRAAVALAALEHLLDQANEALEEIDDSDGEATAALYEARDLHVEACGKAKPDPMALAGQLFERELASVTDLWTKAHRTYARPLGKRGRAEYRRLADAAWRQGGWSRVRDILDAFAADDGDVDARIALRASEATSAHDYADLAGLCLRAGRRAEALAWAEEGMWRLEDRPDQHLTMLTAELLREAGRRADAEALLWKAFARRPEARLHSQLKETAKDRGDLTDRCASLIEARILSEKAEGYWSPLPRLLIDMLLADDRASEAWAAARKHRCSPDVIERLARATEASHPDDAIAAYADLVESHVKSTHNSSYEAACALLRHLGSLRARRGESAIHIAHLESLRTRHKAKRNFIRLLDQM